MQLPEIIESHDKKTSYLSIAWDAIKASRGLAIGAGAVVLTGVTSIHFYNNEEKVISTVLKEPEISFMELDNDTTLIKQGESIAVRYKGIVCPVAMNWPETVTLTLGNTGDASISPSDESPVSTILGTLGVTRNVTIKRELDKNATALMSDFYSHAENCYDKILQMGGPAIHDGANDNITTASPEKPIVTPEI